MSAQVKQLWEEVRNLSLGNTGAVERLPSPPSPLQFLRDFVSQNKPCLISAATLHWPASTLWTSDDSHLLNALSSSSVSVHLTPTGAADSLTPHPSSPSRLCFATAHVESMPFPLALSTVYSSDRDEKFVCYAQQQNDCFRSEYSGISGDCESDIPWASEALGCLPDAVNLWIGNHQSETSFHKDHYENLYAVVSGEKHFLLLPPTDVHRMYIRNYPTAQYKYVKETSKFTLDLVEEPKIQVPWCSVNPYPSPDNMEKERAKFPLFFNGPKPFEVTVKAGEILYLPSMWFHHVRQSPDRLGRTIAINYWYDMQFDIKYAYFNFVRSIPLRLCDQANELSLDQMCDPEDDLSDSNCEDE
ncbi:bifunctional peptidase and (3S)-lysyl hydroxylase JMJD7 [Impatiens glandulifera]|uniref:bifunctional peptidase and (3S)-lysyl hydroxylase JMJD7 n=1 Tax=Impatiens glandulifera TaxID=253017 RepID=UPI001FB17FDE|nr:bifunctional peptidase and (3S)-lysyl hydroxylase JMJD7 [Impatiens glandulifera]